MRKETKKTRKKTRKAEKKPETKKKRDRSRKRRVEDLPFSVSEDMVADLAKTLIERDGAALSAKRLSSAKTVLRLIAAGAFLAASIAIPNLPLALKPFLKDVFGNEETTWKRFSIPYLKRTLRRLTEQRLVETKIENGFQVVTITEAGRRKILKYAFSELKIVKPKEWDGYWRLVAYDIPHELKFLRGLLRENLLDLGFYPFQESVFLHAYPCDREVEFLREYLGVGEFVRIFQVSAIENNQPFRDFFGV